MSYTSSCTYECAVVVRQMSAILLKIKNNIQLLNIPGIITKFTCTSIPQISLSSDARCRKRSPRRIPARRSRAAGRTIVRYLRDVVKTHARNSDVTPGHASARTHWPFMKSRPEAHSPSGSAPLGSAGVARVRENAPVGRYSVHSISFICRIIVVFLFAAQGRANEQVLALKVPGIRALVGTWSTAARHCLPAVAAAPSASLNKRVTLAMYKVAESRCYEMT